MKKKIFSSLLLVAVAIASTSMFVSCKDYDDDINKNANAISALENTIKTLEQSTLPGLYLTIAEAKRDYATIVELNKKADATALNNYALKTDLKEWALKSDLKDWALKSELTPLQEWIKGVESAKYLEDLLKDLKAFNDQNKGGYVKANDEQYLKLVNALAGFDENLAEELKKYATQEGLDGRLNPIESAFKNVELQEGIIKAYFDKIDELYRDQLTAESKQVIEDLKNGLYVKKAEFDKLPTKLQDFTNDDLAKLKDIMLWYDNKVKEEAGVSLNVIQYMLDGRLSSLVFYPEYYIGGIETIEVPVLAYQPIISKVPVKRVDDANEEDEHFEYYKNSIYGSLQTEDGIASLDPSELYSFELGKVNFDEAPWTLVGVYADKFKKEKVGYTYASSPLYGTAKYHFNPTTTRLDGMSVQFIDHQPYAIEALGAPTSLTGGNESEATATESRIAASKRYVALQKEASNAMVDNGLINVNIGFKDHAAFEAYVEQIVNNADLMTIKNDNFSNAVGAKYQTNIDVVALQLIKGDTVVTSDYAAVCPTIYHVRHIADVAPSKTWTSDQTIADAQFATTMPKCDLTAQMAKDYPDMRPLFMTAKTAVADVPTHFVNYKEKFDVRPLIRTHFTYIAPESTLRNEFLHKYEKNVADEDALLAKLGLHYEYYLVDWISGTNVTSESMHMEHLTAAGESKASADNRDPEVRSSLFIARPTDVKTGMTRFGEEADRYVLDREPLIRVELRTEGGDIIEAGYIKVILSEKVDQISKNPIPVVKDFEGPYDMNCSNADSMTWYEFENIVLAAKKDDGTKALDLNKIEFDKFYQPDFVVAADGIFARYIQNADGTFSPETVDKRGLMGDVTWKEDVKNKETSIVKFEFGDPQNAIKLLGVKKNADGTLMLNEKPYETWIRFVDINGVYGDVYLKLSIGEEKLQYVIAQVKNKILSYWYNFNGTDKDQAQEAAIPTNVFEDFDVRMNVYTPNVINRPLTTDDFEKDLYEYFYNPKYDEKNITPEGVAHDILDWKLSGSALKDANGKDRFDQVSKHGEFILVNPFDNGTDKNTNHFASKWEVKGYSGDLYTLRVTDREAQGDGYVQYIIAKKGTVEEKIVSLTYTPDSDPTDTNNDETAILKLMKSEFGYDIMNYVGHSSVTDDNLVFTAYLKVESPEACYSFVERPYFNVRFLRPINWYPKGEYTITDAPNLAQIIELNKLISFNDWRTTDNTNEIPYSNYTGNSYVVADQAALFTAGTTPAKEITSYKYYGIKLTSNDKECLTDIHRGEDARTLLTAAQVKEALRNIEKDVMSENRVRYTGTFSGLDLKYDAAKNAYTYQNNKGNVQYFHIYVPLYIQYTFSPWETEHLFIKTWSAITVNKTVSNAKQN